jgi:hypothetical protein
MPWAVAAAGVTAAAGLAGSAMQSGAAGKAGERSQAALQQSRNDLMPWMTQGGTALGVTGDLSGANGPDAARAAMGNFFTSPGYQFRLDEGMRGVDAGAAARGLLRSGSTLKAEQKFAQGLASDEFSNYYNRLFDLSNQGLGAAKAEAGVGSDMARSAQQTGAAQSSIYGNAAGGLANTANSLFSNKDFTGWLGGQFGGGGGATPTFGSLGGAGLY